MPPNHRRSVLAFSRALISAGGDRLSAVAADQRLDLGRQRNFLQGAGEDAAALADQRLVVIVPAGAGQGEQPLALLAKPVAASRIGVQEDVAMVERRHQPDVLGQQHAIAEHIARHVAHADDGEILVLDVACPARGNGA